MCDQITHNSRVHDMIAPLYEARHGEIFNRTEQLRICDSMAFALKYIRTGSEVPRVLDFGAGTGNLTRHLLSMGAEVVASDVSAGCLRELKSSTKNAERLELSLLNGHDLSQFADESFDMVATYSVLHHIPDYLAIVSEFIRVVKPGGIVYIDHEVCPAYWENRPEYQTYCREIAEHLSAQPDTLFQRISNIVRQDRWWRYLSSALRVRWNKVADEGDIHVHPDDHIEWPKIRSCLEPFCEILREHDYLVCRERTFSAPVWEKWRSQCVDMRLLVAGKR
ncbi:MAG TPA: class I SAM-dependent methyltransferase [Dongiaceae bacterium]|nr:class I SAM-dependent methyltransferase [Dongiaceae bacterium]